MCDTRRMHMARCVYSTRQECLLICKNRPIQMCDPTHCCDMSRTLYTHIHILTHRYIYLHTYHIYIFTDIHTYKYYINSASLSLGFARLSHTLSISFSLPPSRSLALSIVRARTLSLSLSLSGRSIFLLSAMSKAILAHFALFHMLSLFLSLSF